MLSWHIWHRPLIFHRSQLRHEHVSKCLSTLLLIWIYLFVWLVKGPLTQLLTVSPPLPTQRRGQWWGGPTGMAPQTAWMAGFMARCAHPRHKTHFLWVDHSACPCFIDLAPLKFTTSAIPACRLTGRRFSAGMRSDGGRGREQRGGKDGLTVGSLRMRQNGFGGKEEKGGN